MHSRFLGHQSNTHGLNIKYEAILTFDPVMPYNFIATTRLITVVIQGELIYNQFVTKKKGKSILIKFGAKKNHSSDKCPTVRLILFSSDLHCNTYENYMINKKSIISSIAF